MIKTALIYLISDICLDKIFNPIIGFLSTVKEKNVLNDGQVLDWVEFIRGNKWCRISGGIRVEDQGKGIVVFWRTSDNTQLWYRELNDDLSWGSKWYSDNSTPSDTKGWAALWKDVLIWDLSQR